MLKYYLKNGLCSALYRRFLMKCCYRTFVFVDFVFSRTHLHKHQTKTYFFKQMLHFKNANIASTTLLAICKYVHTVSCWATLPFYGENSLLMIKGNLLRSLATMQATQCKTAKVDSLQIWTHVGAHPAPGGWSYPSPACQFNEVCSWEHGGTPPLHHRSSSPLWSGQCFGHFWGPN